MRLFLILHLALCFIITQFYIRKGTDRRIMIPILFCIPVCGLLLLWIKEHNRKKQENKENLETESLKIWDTKYKRIAMDFDQNQKKTVPLEEAIIMNDSVTRRSILMDAIRENSCENVAMLKTARNAKDTELAHYATTVMMELQGKYEMQIGEEKEKYERDKTKENEESYQQKIKEYILSGLITGNVLKIYRIEWDRILNDLFEKNALLFSQFQEMIKNLMALEEYEKIKILLEKGKKEWPEEEKMYQLMMAYSYVTKDQEQIRLILREVKEKNIFLSRQGRKWYTFWNQNEG